MKPLRLLFVALVGLVNAVPGWLELRGGLLAPPAHESLFGGFLIAASVVAVIAVLLASKRIGRLEASRVVRQSFAVLALSALLAPTYLWLRSMTVFPAHDTDGKHPRKIYMPLVPTGDLAKWIERLDSRSKVVDEYPRHVEDWVSEQPGRLAFTTGCLLAVYVATLLATTIAVSAAAVRLSIEPSEVSEGPDS